MQGIEPIDILVGAVLSIAALRGLFLGLIREAFSLAGIASGYLVVRLFARPVADWLLNVSGGDVPAALAPWLAGAGLFIFTVAVVTFAGRVLRKGVRAVGLGIADRLGGAVLGVAEGAVVVALLLALVGRAVGWDHPALADTRTVAALAQLDLMGPQAGQPTSVDVASPPPGT
jgi:membrane protein required for colicin V production